MLSVAFAGGVNRFTFAQLWFKPWSMLFLRQRFHGHSTALTLGYTGTRLLGKSASSDNRRSADCER